MATTCAFPQCGLPVDAGLRECSSCVGKLHHACFAQWCFDNKLPDPEGIAAYCWGCVLKDPSYKKIAEQGAQAEDVLSTLESFEALEQIDPNGGEPFLVQPTPVEDASSNTVGQLEGSSLLGEEQLNADFFDENEDAGTLNEVIQPASASTPASNVSQALREGARVLMSFGVPPCWYGGIVKLPRTADDSIDDMSDSMYVAFDDGELRKFSKGLHEVGLAEHVR